MSRNGNIYIEGIFNEGLGYFAWAEELYRDITGQMVEAFEAKFLECARTRPDSTLRDDMRAALEAALGAREGK